MTPDELEAFLAEVDASQARVWRPAGAVGEGEVDDWMTGDPAEVVDLAADLLEAFTYRPGWHRRAACRGQGPAAWFPERGDHARPGKAVCETCPVRPECASAGRSEAHGTWGGMSPKERRSGRRDAA